ncbi:hypothetical protein B0H14DRAFT_486941 [Mycena olivaceomarginata]|nr:hypothetical protein B0H14DRAFT_486941 [Mycena olivaceomarginata]
MVPVLSWRFYDGLPVRVRRADFAFSSVFWSGADPIHHPPACSKAIRASWRTFPTVSSSSPPPSTSHARRQPRICTPAPQGLPANILCVARIRIRKSIPAALVLPRAPQPHTQSSTLLISTRPTPYQRHSLHASIIFSQFCTVYFLCGIVSSAAVVLLGSRSGFRQGHQVFSRSSSAKSVCSVGATCDRVFAFEVGAFLRSHRKTCLDPSED